MKGKTLRRRQLIVNRSVQLKYIAMSVIPALVLSIFCATFLVKSGEFLLRMERDVVAIKIAALDTILDDVTVRNAKDTVLTLKREVFAFQTIVNTVYSDALRKWSDFKTAMVLGIVAVLLIVAALSVIYSHRIAGPMIRLHRCIKMLSEGKEVSLIAIRQYDEFQEVADALEKLRQKLREKK